MIFEIVFSFIAAIGFNLVQKIADDIATEKEKQVYGDSIRQSIKKAKLIVINPIMTFAYVVLMIILYQIMTTSSVWYYIVFMFIFDNLIKKNKRVDDWLKSISSKQSKIILEKYKNLFVYFD